MIEELLFNAFKFSEPGSKIYFVRDIKDNFHISILNTLKEIQKNKMEFPEYQNIIFEPFFRISRLVYDKYPTLDFGLGLCHVEKLSAITKETSAPLI